jgi:ABC-type dipeptide/oligopeptide/nickel transport system ATPase subunit
MAHVKVNPFKELQAFTEANEGLFFGRDKEIEQLLNKIYRNRVVGLFGESGTGETSLLNAGLIPILRTEGFIVVPVRGLDDPRKKGSGSLLMARCNKWG